MATRNDLARILWPREAPVDEGRLAALPYETATTRELPPHPEELEARIAHPLAKIAAELHAIREMLEPSSGRPFTLPNGANCDAAGNGTAIYDGPRPGNVWRVELVIVSVSGASAGASLEVYMDGPAIDESNIVGFLRALDGNNPSRGFLALERPAVIWGGNPFLVRVLGAVANAQVTCRIQGSNEAIGG